ncbi:RNA-binding protein 7 isoform X1 [Gopherus flavomarginatus]|uniref:RNA-binding protein 7 isoform X1 n=1 Tax=Gopherus flavomarginatus TaxID=286002 RepID=UPI0021CBC053|nr:RNA-binding protein 7 isoform X1 [Gopherus flavomarginatus]
MGAAAAEANRTLFVGNLDPRVTEELIFELFHQAGPVIKVKIPKDRDGKPKQFAFVNFKHEESVPYGMSLLNGIKLFGRPIKIQFRSGSSHASQDGNSSYSQHGTANTSPSSTPHSTPNSNSRYDRSTDNTLATGFTSVQMLQRSFSSPDNLQRQVMNSGTWQQSQYSGKYGSPHSDQSTYTSPGQHQSHSFNQSSGSQMQRRPDGSSAQRKNRLNSHPYHMDSRHFNREQRFADYGSDHHYRGNRDEYSYEDRSPHDPGSDHYSRGNRDEYCYEDRSHDGWSQDYNRRENYRDGKWRPSRH